MWQTSAVLLSFLPFVAPSWAQSKLSVHWEELTASDFRSGIQQSQGSSTPQEVHSRDDRWLGVSLPAIDLYTLF
jgi:hypothetical protein